MLTKLLSTNLGWWGFVVGTILLFLAVIEVGFRIGRGYREPGEQERKAQTGTVLAALLGLLAFVLAITFSIAEGRFSQRKALVLEEANAIGTTYLRTDFLPEPQRAEARRILKDYLRVRIAVADKTLSLPEGLARSNDIHRRLWSLADAAAEAEPRSVPLGLFIDALNETIDLHQERVTVSLVYRLPPSLMWTLYLVALMAMGTLGIHFGLSGPRNTLVVVALVVAFTAILLLIVDLDQSQQRLFSVTQQPLVDTLETLDSAP